MKNFLNREIDRFLHYKKAVRGFSENSYKTYKLNLEESKKYIDIEIKNEKYYINLMPYRLYISKKSKKTIAKKISIIRSFVQFLQENSYKVKLIGDLV